MSQSVKHIFYYQETFNFVKKHIKIFINIIHIWISFVCIFISSDVEKKMTCPYMYLRRTWSVSHIRLKVNKTCIYLISQEHTFCSIQVGLRNGMLLIIIYCPLKLTYCIRIPSSFCKNEAYKIENHRIWFCALVEALIKVFECCIKIVKSVIKKTSDHVKRWIVLNGLYFLNCPHCWLKIFLLFLFHFFWD